MLSSTNQCFSNNGNIGIGTTTPINILNVVANSSSYSDPQYTSGLRINDVSNTTAIVTGIAADFNNGYIQTAQPNVSWASRSLVFQPMGGYVGIGTKNPGAMLDVNGSQRLNGDLTFAADQTSFLIHALGNGGAIRIRSNIYSATDRNVQFGAIDNNGTWASYMIVDQGGNVGIGTLTPDTKLAVNGTIHSQEVLVDMNGWSDFVFNPSYNLASLLTIKNYLDKNHHLPDMPSEKEVMKDGVNVGDMLKLQTQKIEELTLYLIEKDQQLTDPKKEIEQLKQKQEARIAALEQALSKLTSNSKDKD